MQSSIHVVPFLIVSLMSCWTDLLNYHSTADETNEDLTQSFTDKSRGLPQASHSTEQSVFSSECVRVDTSNQSEDCKQSDTPCDTGIHVESGKQTFTCVICDNKFTHEPDFLNHLLVHASEEPSSCEQDSNKKSKQPSHIDTATKSRFICKVCNMKITNSRHLKCHMRIHADERPFSCKVCDKKFALSSHLKYHMSTDCASVEKTREDCTQSLSENTFSCRVCDKKFAREREFFNHMLIHGGQYPCSCKVCNKTFTKLC